MKSEYLLYENKVFLIKEAFKIFFFPEKNNEISINILNLNQILLYLLIQCNLAHSFFSWIYNINKNKQKKLQLSWITAAFQWLALFQEKYNLNISGTNGVINSFYSPAFADLLMMLQFALVLKFCCLFLWTIILVFAFTESKTNCD